MVEEQGQERPGSTTELPGQDVLQSSVPPAGQPAPATHLALDKVRDSDQDSSHPAHGRGKESGSRLPQDDLGKVPWQLWQKPWTSQSWALSRSSPASLGRVMWACPHSRRRVLGFSTGTAISWEHKADAPDFLLSWTWPLCLCYWLTLIGVFWL